MLRHVNYICTYYIAPDPYPDDDSRHDPYVEDLNPAGAGDRGGEVYD